MRNGLILVFGVVAMSAFDALAAPDTLIGARNQSGQIFVVDDDGSLLGDGRASGLYGLPTNNGSIAFAVTGYPDQAFLGAHTQSGSYEVFVDVYDFFGDPIGSFSELETLLPGTVQEYTWAELDWIGGSYDVYVDNTVPEPGGLSILAAAVLLPCLRRPARIGRSRNERNESNGAGTESRSR